MAEPRRGLRGLLSRIPGRVLDAVAAIADAVNETLSEGAARTPTSGRAPAAPPAPTRTPIQAPVAPTAPPASKKRGPAKPAAPAAPTKRGRKKTESDVKEIEAKPPATKRGRKKATDAQPLAETAPKRDRKKIVDEAASKGRKKGKAKTKPKRSKKAPPAPPPVPARTSATPEISPAPKRGRGRPKKVKPEKIVSPQADLLLRQLSRLTESVREAEVRLEELGFGEEAKSILGQLAPIVPEIPTAPIVEEQEELEVLPQVSVVLPPPPAETPPKTKPTPPPPPEPPAAPEPKKGCPANPVEGQGGGLISLRVWMMGAGIGRDSDPCWPKDTSGAPLPGTYLWRSVDEDGGAWFWYPPPSPKAKPEVKPVPPLSPEIKAQYDLEGSKFVIPFQANPIEAYKFLMDAWKRAGIGQVRAAALPGDEDSAGRPRGEILGQSLFNPVVHLESRAPGTLVVPQEALASEESFGQFLKDWNIQGGVQLRVEGIVSRNAPTIPGKKVWIPPEVRIKNKIREPGEDLEEDEDGS